MTLMIRRTAAISGAIVMAGLLASGCATHKFVRKQVAVVDSRVSSVDERVTGVDQHVTAVEGKAGEALERANAAHKLAEGKFLYQVVLSDDSVKFPTDEHALARAVASVAGDRRRGLLGARARELADRTWCDAVDELATLHYSPLTVPITGTKVLNSS